MPGSRKGRNGFTLIEILAVVALIAILATISIRSFRKNPSRQMRMAALKLASTLQFLYNKAASEGVTLQLVFDMGSEEHSYLVKVSSEQVTLKKEDQGPFAKKEKKKGEKEPQFSPYESRLLKPVKLPKGIFFKDIQVEHRREAVSEGEAEIHFFPHGYVEQSVINLRDEEDKIHFSLEVNPMSGSCLVKNGYKEAEFLK